VEGCYFVSVSLSVFLSLRAGSTSFRYQMVCALSGEKYFHTLSLVKHIFHENVFTNLFCLVLFQFSFE
jgi:hypothetical protein